MKKGKKRNNSLLYTLTSIIVIVLILLFGNKLSMDNIETMFSNVSENTVLENSSDINTNVIEGQDVIVRFFDVGQADAILVQSAGMNMLIDAGTNNMGNTVVQNLINLGINKIDYLVGTHPHEDHIGGMDDVINNFEIGTIYMPRVQTNTKTFEDVLDAINNKGLTITTPDVGYIFELGNTKCEIMNAGTGTSEENSNLNLASIVIRMVYGDESFLFMGDAEQINENSRDWPQTTVLKVGHHGSDTSSSTNFLNQVKPEISVISVGINNMYGHPKQIILDRLNTLNSKIYRTDQNGTITIVCDGTKCVVNTEK